MRRTALALVVAAATACASSAPADPVDGLELCRRISAAVVEGATGCCGPAHVGDGARAVMANCVANIAPWADDPRNGFDPSAADDQLDRLRADLAACEVPDPRRLVDWRALFPGTLALGATCLTDATEPAPPFVCRDGFCSMSSSGLGAGSCSPFVVEGAGCATDQECVVGAYCSRRPDSDRGVCARLLVDGMACIEGVQCLSTVCEAGSCAPLPSGAQFLCAPATPTAVSITLTLTGFPTSPTRETNLRIVDASGAQLVAYRMIGLGSTASSQTIARAIPSSASGLTAQLWTMDPGEAVPEMRSWEQPLQVGATDAAITGDYAAPTQPLSSMPVFDLDTTFDVQTFGFDGEIGRPFHVRLVEAATGRTVVEGRLDAITDFAFQVTLLEAVRPGVAYAMLVYVDENGDDRYQPPPIDHAWRASATAPASGGLSLPWAWSSSFQDVGYGP